MLKKLTALLLVALMSLTAAACKNGTENKKPDELNLKVCIASEPESIDPTIISSVDGSTYVQHMYEGLMKYQQNKKLAGEDDSVYLTDTVYGQAKSYEVSTDGLVYTFHLRDDAVWSDGQPVKASDFVYSWQRLTDPATASDYGYLLTGIVKNATEIQNSEKSPSELGVRAVDDKTFEVTLVTQCPYFISLCSFSTLVPVRKDIVDKYGTSWTDPANIVCNGSFKLTEWTHDSYLKMVPNEKYYDYKNLGPKSITWYLSDSETAILSSFEKGEYDFIENVPTDRIQPMKKDGKLFIIPQISEYHLYLNCTKLTDWRVRAAITLAINRQFIVEKVTQAAQVPATGVVPAGIFDSTGADWTVGHGSPLYDKLASLYTNFDLTKYEGRCALAKELLKQAIAEGKWTEGTTIEYDFNTSEAHKAIAEAVQSDLKSVLGIDTTLANSEWQTYTTNLEEGKFGMARLGWSADYNDAITYLELFTNDNSYNYGKWVNDEYTSLIQKAKSLPGGTERDKLMRQAEEILFSENGFTVCPVYFYTQVYCLADGISNVGFTPLGYFFFNYATKNK
jgi:oligopeptide transport system substrate-binding protein